MKKLLTIMAMLSVISVSEVTFPQDVTQVTFLNELDSKSVATYGDALIMFKLQGGSNVPAKGKYASKKGAYSLEGYTESDPLSKGMASLMTARYLDLGGSFMYMIFDTERYAFKACVANGIFSPEGSENDPLSGPELIELFSKISDIKGGN